jgi:hypothetical protein
VWWHIKTVEKNENFVDLESGDWILKLKLKETELHGMNQI